MQELDRLRDMADPERAARASARHKSGRETLGVPPAQIEALAAEWRGALDIDARLALARALWDSDIHEARLTAARLLVQARMRPDDAAWALLLEWAVQIDGAEIGDAVMSALARRLVAEPARLDLIAAWSGSRNPWLRRGLLMATLPWAKLSNPKPEDVAVQEMVLERALRLSADRNGAVRQAALIWARDLAKHDPDRVAQWHGARAEMAEPEPEPEAETGPDTDAGLDTEAGPDTGAGDLLD
ncbi:DNA alkylation repair protein [Paracoccus nototheniae]|uniref:DNA alkylation repair protein n=1 Tax=Paracoccus nototheniae TaxID=2489002 RepID=A0ABW4DW30_9RHOB|nr:DNA alkylation repair protein [Paracoccus nototheniae]